MRIALSACLLAAASAAVLSGGCASPLRLVERTPYGDVWASDEDAGRAEAARVRRYAAALDDLDAPLDVRPVEVRLVRNVPHAHAYGGYIASQHVILIQADREHADESIAHELVHAFEHPSWERLPAIVREGLADHLALRVAPDAAARLRQRRIASLTVGRDAALADDRPSLLDPETALTQTVADLARMTDLADLRALYGMGLLLVDRGGVDAFHLLASEAVAAGDRPVSAAAVLQAANAPADLADWGAIIDAHTDAADSTRDVRD